MRRDPDGVAADSNIHLGGRESVLQLFGPTTGAWGSRVPQAAAGRTIVKTVSKKATTTLVTA